MLRRCLPIVALVLLSACGSKSPTQPSNNNQNQTVTPTRIILLEANLSFGTVNLGDTTTRILKIRNTGNSTMTVTGLSITAGLGSIYSASWTSGSIGANSFQDVTIGFTPINATAYNGTITVNADHTSGTNSMSISGTGNQVGPRTNIPAGTFRVNSELAAGRYFTRPVATGCYWERLSGLGGTSSEIIANDFVSFLANQLIVDIKGSDTAFSNDSDCGTWTQTPRTSPPSGSLTPGTWLVGSQIQPGTYKVQANSGCYWERLRGFSGQIADVIANNFVSSAGQQLVTISASDVGFNNDADCGTWAPSGDHGLIIQSIGDRQDANEIRLNRDAHRARLPLARTSKGHR